jgi:hypothetical protein
MNQTHTPGPWQISGAIQPSTRPDGLKILTICAPDPDGGGQDIAYVLESCAPVVAAAPDLLAALAKLVYAVNGVPVAVRQGIDLASAMNAADEAIARARGD